MTARSKLVLLLTCFTILVPSLVLIGWVIDNEYLKRIVPTLVQMNPISAVLFISASISLLLSYRKPNHGKGLFASEVLATCIIIVGLIMTLKYVLNIDLHIDELLFNHKLEGNRMAPNTAGCFFLLGVILLSGHTKKRIPQLIQQIAVLLILFLTLQAVLGYIYNLTSLYQFRNYIPMALHTASCFILLSFAIVTVHQEFYLSKRIHNYIVQSSTTTKMNFGLLLCFIILLGMTFYAWKTSIDNGNHQVKNDFEIQTTAIQDSVEKRLVVYRNALYDIRGLFAASKSVERDEFHQYLEASNIQESFPGITGISFIQRVTQKDKQAFIIAVRNDKSMTPEGYPTFTIHPAGERSEYYALTYAQIATSSAAVIASKAFGLDFLTNTDRAPTLMKAVDTNTAQATNVTKLLTTPPKKGFIIYLPIYMRGLPIDTPLQRRQAALGTISAGFAGDELFKTILKEKNISNIRLAVYDTNDESKTSPKTLLYESAQNNPTAAFKKEVIYPFAGRNWHLEFSSLPEYQNNTDQAAIPTIVLISGVIISFLITFTLYSLINARRRALIYANKVTRDLREEEIKLRDANRAIDKHRKQLAVKVDDLERINNVMVNRELRMIELKKQLKGMQNEK